MQYMFTAGLFCQFIHIVEVIVFCIRILFWMCLFINDNSDVVISIFDCKDK